MTPEAINDKIRSILKATAEVYMSPKATSAADALTKGYLSLGNINGFGANPEVEKKETNSARRGSYIRSKSGSGVSKLGYNFDFNNMTADNVGMIVGHDVDYDFGAIATDNARSVISATAGAPFDFDAGTDGVAALTNRWYPILDASGNRARNLTACSFAGVELAYGAAGDGTALAEDVDYYLDRKLGLVMFTAAIDDDVITPTLTCAAITSASNDYMKRIVPNQKFLTEGYFMIMLWDEDANWGLALEHEPFYGRIMSNGEVDFGDDFASGSLSLDVLDGSTMLVRSA